MTAEKSTIVVVLTALGLEFDAVRRPLTGVSRQTHSAGTIFEVGSLTSSGARVAVAVVGPGNGGAAVLAERAITMFEPRALLFVGVAGGLSDSLALGDVVVATRVYAVHGGREDDQGFRSRPRSWDAPHDLEQLARAVARTEWWPGQDPAEAPEVHFKPIASAEVVLNSRSSPLIEHIRLSYNDAAAIEMEGAGASLAGHLSHVPVLAVRGISDLADGSKHMTDGVGWQPAAAANAADFALALIDELGVDSSQHGVASTEGVGYGVLDGTIAGLPSTAIPAPSETASVPETSTATPSESRTPATSVSRQNAVESAKNYLGNTAFSRGGLIEQLEYEKFTTADATYAVDHVTVDWGEQAVKSAKSYLKDSAFSRRGLIEQLEYGKFTTADATYAVDHVTVDWNEQAAKSAKSYLDGGPFSRGSLIDQLAYGGFTAAQAEHGAGSVGL